MGGAHDGYHFGQRFTRARTAEARRTNAAVYSFPLLFLLLFFYNMAYNVSKKGCFKCGNRASFHSHTSCHAQSYRTVGHFAENCTSQERLCYNCRKPGHESSTCPEPRSVSSKQCYTCGGIGHIQAECPTLRLQGSNQKCYVMFLYSLQPSVKIV